MCVVCLSVTFFLLYSVFSRNRHSTKYINVTHHIFHRKYNHDRRSRPIKQLSRIQTPDIIQKKHNNTNCINKKELWYASDLHYFPSPISSRPTPVIRIKWNRFFLQRCRSGSSQQAQNNSTFWVLARTA